MLKSFVDDTKYLQLFEKIESTEILQFIYIQNIVIFAFFYKKSAPVRKVSLISDDIFLTHLSMVFV